jgi:Zn-dependent metalloprotease
MSHLLLLLLFVVVLYGHPLSIDPIAQKQLRIDIQKHNIPMDYTKSIPIISHVYPSIVQNHLFQKHLFPQTYGNTSIPVLYGFYHVIQNLKTDELTVMNNFRKVDHDVSTEPMQSIASAKAAALRAWCTPKLKNCDYSKMQVSLVMWPSPTVICYNVTFSPVIGFMGSSMTYIVDGNNLQILAEIDNRHRIGGSGNSLYNGVVSFNSNLYSNTYYLEDTGRKYGTYDCLYTNCTAASRLTNTNTRWTTYNNSINAHYAVSKAYDYFSTTFSRNGIDGSGGPGVVTSADGRTSLFPHLTDYEVNYNDAFYTPEGIYYGAGDGINFTQLVSLDFVGHEYMHGIISFIVGPNLGFVYANESGALEEAYCDVFGAMVELYALGSISNKTWMIGEDFYTPNISGDALRYLDYPHKAANMGYTADDNPDYITQIYTGSLDNGGVHVNCGVPSKAFYLLAMGGQHELGGPNMTGVGTYQASKIWWQALTTYLTPSSQFSDARLAQMYAARDLYGSESFEVTEVEAAWYSVGLGTLPAPYVLQIISNPSLESSSSPWTFTSSDNSSIFVSSGSFAHSGKGYAELGVVNNALGYLTQTPSTMTYKTVSANLTFWLEIVTTDTVAYSDLLNLYIKNGNTGTYTLLDQYFNNQAGSYVMKGPYNLMSYVGIPFTVEFEVISNANNPTTFYIDDVNINIGYY